MFTALLTLALAADPMPGHLVAVGGGSSTPEITRRTLELAGGSAARVLVIPQASATSTGEASVAMWRERGAKEVSALDLKDPAAAVKAVKAADLIWIPGGDQNRLMQALMPTDLPAAIRARHRKGATVGGTSAGTAVISTLCLTGEADLDRIRHGTTGVREGLGLWPGVIVDQHFVRRERFNRLLAAVLDRPALVGVGVDENTAAVVTGTKFEVIGAGQVLVIDARKAKAAPGKKGDLAAAEGVTLHVLTAGMTFDLK
jgi:cyanophycinase